MILPFAVSSCSRSSSPDVDPTIELRSYFDFVTTLFLAFGILMEFPILLVGLSRVGS